MGGLATYVIKETCTPSFEMTSDMDSTKSARYRRVLASVLHAPGLNGSEVSRMNRTSARVSWQVVVVVKDVDVTVVVVVSVVVVDVNVDDVTN